MEAALPGLHQSSCMGCGEMTLPGPVYSDRGQPFPFAQPTFTPPRAYSRSTGGTLGTAHPPTHHAVLDPYEVSTMGTT